MLFRGRFGDSLFTLSLQPHWLTIGVDEAFIVSWDRGGRLYSVYRHEHTFRRGLNGRVLEKWQDTDGERRWDTLDPVDAEALVDDGARLAARVRDAIGSRQWSWIGEPPASDEFDAALGRALAFTGAASRRDAARFAEIYSPVGILPPDQYLSVVVQATEGCSFNTCTFCDLYGGHYRVKTAEEFEAHLGAVHDFLGLSLGLRGRGIFVGSANALAVPMARLTPMFEAIGRVFPDARGGLAAFLDGFTGVHKSAADFGALRDLGLQRVYIGLETGHDPLLGFVRKPATRAQVIDTVRAVKEGGVHVGLIVMTGLGGEAFAEAHVTDTIAALNDMPLDGNDLLYFSDLVEQPGTPYPALASDRAIRPLSAEQRAEQRQAIREGLRVGALPHVATYDVREFVY
jgi:hypothetical protein